jgi:hypothetical protein
MLFYLFGWIVWPAIIASLMTDWYPVSFPFTIRAIGFCFPTSVCIDFRWTALIADVVFWYVLSAIGWRARFKVWDLGVCLVAGVLGTCLIAKLLLVLNIL